MGVFEFITQSSNATILEIKVIVFSEMVNMIDHEIESKETGRIEIGIEMTLVMYI